MKNDNNSLDVRLQHFNPQRPYVWGMKITENEFCSLEDELRSYSPDVTKKADALKVLVYVAEWYKRRYSNRDKTGYQKIFAKAEVNLATVWQTLGIDERYLYCGSLGQRLYLHSTFVLGGLAVKFELERNDNRFLRTLCRVYNGELSQLDNLVDNNHSIAFRESVAQMHCLYDFVVAILSSSEGKGTLPFATEDIENGETQMMRLIDKIRDINALLQKSKFRLEWVVRAAAGDPLISRRLRLWLNPEKQGQFHHLIHRDRLIRWGFKDPDALKSIRFGLRYFHGRTVVQEPDFWHPDLYFRNTGESKVGFICEEPDYVVRKNVPVRPFDRVELIAWIDENTELPEPVYAEDIDFSAKQFYLLTGEDDLWSDRVSNQHETALLFTDPWSLAESSIDRQVDQRRLYAPRYEGTDHYVNWCPISTAVTIEGGKDSPLTFFNRQGYDHIQVRLYQDIIRYLPDGKVMWHHADDEESPEETSPINLIFGKDDIVAFHTEEREEDNSMIRTEVEVEQIEYLQSGREYTVWDEQNAPQSGYVKLRITIKQRALRFEAFYIPKPITRDCKTGKICYPQDDMDRIYDDQTDIEEAILNSSPLDPVVLLKIGHKTDFVEVPVYRPTKIKEVCLGNKVLMYDNDGKVELPYILKDLLVVNDFSENGYESYECSLFKDIYPEAARYKESGKYTDRIDGRTFTDDKAPGCLCFFIRKAWKEDTRLRYCRWNCAQGTRPQPLADSRQLPDGWTAFQDQRRITSRIECRYLEKESRAANPFARARGITTGVQVSYIEVFNIAVEYNQYFFYFAPLRNLANSIIEGNRSFKDEIYTPLLELRHGILSDKDKASLLRFATEFGLEKVKEELNIAFNQS